MLIIEEEKKEIEKEINIDLAVVASQCYDSPWTGLLTSGDDGCYRWTAVGVRVTPLGRCNINRMTWEYLCDGHTWTYNRWTHSKQGVGVRS